MSCAVNLVPAQRLRTRARLRRRNAWLGVGAALALVAAAAGGTRVVAQRALTRVMAAEAVLGVQRTEVQRRLTTADARRAALLEQLKTVAAARRPQLWAPRLLGLVREIPDGVFLTGIDITAVEPDASAAANPRPAGQTARGEGAAAPPPAPVDSNVQNVRLRGFALDHPTLLRFVSVLEALRGWQRVELVRASQEAATSGQAVGFELSCRTTEDVP